MELLPTVRLEYLRAYELHIMSQHAMVLEHPPALERLSAVISHSHPTNTPGQNGAQGSRCHTSPR